MRTLDEILKEEIGGLYYGNRIILPFSFHPLKVNVDKQLITDFSGSSKGIEIIEHDDFTDLYFLDYDEVTDVISEYEAIKMILVEKGKNVFDFSSHRQISLYLEDKHKVKIQETDKDILFIE